MSDVDFFGLETAAGAGRYQVEVANHLSRLDGQLYGGAAIGMSMAAAEAVTGRTVVWTTTQYVSTVALGHHLSLHVEVLASGRRTNQVRVTGTSEDGGVVFASLGATGIHRPEGLTGEFERMPKVSDPSSSERWASPISGLAKSAGFPDLPPEQRRKGFSGAVEFRGPELTDHPDPGPGRSCMWIRRRDGAEVTPAVAAYMADMVPMSVAAALGVIAAGTSLDNTVRIGAFVPTEWVLLDLRPHLAVGGYGHGIAHVWSEDGHLLATASQTAGLRVFDQSELPPAPSGS
jgi:acyl-CoA thioesterase-2